MRGGPTGRAASPMMIGRVDELRHLAQLIHAPGPGVAILAGEPGIGKTRLVNELLNCVPAGGTVLVGQAEPGTLGRPFELLLSAVDSKDDVDANALEALTDTTRTQVERLRIGLQLLHQLTSSGPAVIVFEDLHWADSESIALFERIADLGGNRLLVGTYRPEEVMRRNPVAGLLDRLERRHAIYHIRLERLSLAETSAFLSAVSGKPPSYRTAVALHNRTGGNPFFLEELVRSSDDVDELFAQPLPWSLAETLRRQVENLDPEHRRMVEAAAVLGYRVPFDLLAAVTATPESGLIASLRELVARGVLVETNEDEFAFRHALVREAIGERLLGRERRRLHEAALTALVAAESHDWALIAKHAQGAGRFDDMLTAVHKGCADYLSIGSAFPALELAEMGLEEASDDAHLLATAARAAWLAGLLDDADGYAQRWRGAADASDAVAALALQVRLAWERQDWLALNTRTTLLERAALELSEGPDQARAMATLAQSARLRDLDEEALRWADRATALAERVGALPAVRLAAMGEKGALLASRAATIDQGRALLAQVADEAEKAGEWLIAAQSLNKLVHLPPVRTARELADLLERMRTDAERAGSEALAVAAYFQGRARLFVRKGNLAAAIDAVQRGRAHDQSYRRTAARSDFHGVFLAGLLLEAGDLAGAGRVSADLADVPGMDVATPGLEFHLACRRGQVDRAIALLPHVLAVVAATGGRDGEFLHDLTSAALAAPLAAHEITKLVDGLDGPMVEPGYRRLVTAQLAEVSGSPAAALGHFLAAATAESLPPSARGTAQIGAARSLIALGRLDEARVHARAGGDLLERWSGWRVEQAAAVRSRLGLRADEEQQGPAELTPREREVAALIAEGLTNVDLARRLYISPRTAAVHVSNILRKLGVSSRTEVGAVLALRK